MEGNRVIYLAESPAQFRPDVSIESAIRLSLVKSRTGLQQQVVYHCPSSDCDFKTFKSLAVYSQYEDISSSLLQRVQRNRSYILSSQGALPDDEYLKTEYFLPNSLYLHNRDTKKDIYSGPQVYSTIFGMGENNRIVTIKHLSTMI